MGAAEMQLSFFSSGLNITMELFILLVMAFIIGWKVSQVWHLFTFKQILQDLKVSNSDLHKLAKEQGIELDSSDDEEDENSNLPVLEVKVEQHPEGLFAYRKADGFFIAQGKDREKLMENLVNNLTNVRVVVAKEDGADLISP
jgi:ABC-type multidrug transport system fused ATPase/permease subunit